MQVWIAILGMAVVTYIVRAVPLLAMRGALTPWLSRWLSYVPVAVFTALIVHPLLIQSRDGGAMLVFGPALPAGIVGALVSWRTGNILLTIIAGMAAFWLLRWLGW